MQTPKRKIPTFLLLIALALLMAEACSAFSSTSASSPSFAKKEGTKYFDLDTEGPPAGTPAFPIAADDLIQLAKRNFYENKIGLNDGGACLAEDFTFRAQFVEVDKKGMLGALSSFSLEDSFEMKQYFYGWMV